jgi:glycine/D-amino acid oxidase-like deaminating enzyme
MPAAHGPHAANPEHDAVIVGGGPNGLAAAITLAEAGRSVLVLEANDTIGGAARTGELTEPGFRHDLGSAIHPLGVASPFLRRLPLEKHGLEWIWPELPAALGRDGASYRCFKAERPKRRVGISPCPPFAMIEPQQRQKNESFLDRRERVGSKATGHNAALRLCNAHAQP